MIVSSSTRYFLEEPNGSVAGEFDDEDSAFKSWAPTGSLLKRLSNGEVLYRKVDEAWVRVIERSWDE
jgi:hypothetical protein